MPFFVSKTKALANGKTKCRPIAHNPFLYPLVFFFVFTWRYRFRRRQTTAASSKRAW
jgi:hypothetical protein